MVCKSDQISEKDEATHKPDNSGHQLLYIAQACKKSLKTSWKSIRRHPQKKFKEQSINLLSRKQTMKKEIKILWFQIHQKWHLCIDIKLRYFV